MPKAPKLPFPQLIREFWKPYLRLAEYLKPYKKRLMLGLFFGILAGMVNGVFGLVVKIVGDKVLPGGPGVGGFSFSGPAAAAPAVPPPPATFESVIWISLLIPAVMILRGIFTYLNSYCMSWVSLRVLRDIRSQLFSHIMTQSMAFFSTAKSGKLISRVLNDTRMAQNALTSIAGDLVKAPIAVLTGAVVIVMIDWRFSLTTLVLFPLCMIPVIVFGKKIRQAGRAEENEAGQMAVILQETFAGVRVIKSFAREDYQAEEFAKSSDKQCRNSLRVRKSMEMVGPMIESVSAFGVVLALMYVYFFNVSIGQLAGLLTGIFMLYNPVKSLSRIPMQMQKCMASATNIFELLAKKSAVQDAPDAKVITQCAGRITFDGVSFSYGKDKNAVHDISFEIEAGKKYALVGASGAGKTTLLSLVQRFYDPQAGAILLDGRDIRTITQRSLREHIGVVTQETFLFHDTIYENIRYGRLEATRAEIEAAASQAYAHDFILAQPEGYQTVVGDKGCMLSGGQQQRLAIARALLKNAPVLLLDEATSALDSESEKIIQAALERLSHGRTVIAIAHRLSTILKSDAIVVMDQGRVVDIAPHTELLGRSPLYRKLYEMQFHHEEHAATPVS
jgi:subfamily B ATP-binding cassette protein MsbA